ncbi:hypothetical protein F3Y22_tig00015910pilonHSYRG00092 [Hibiscus syriacus]|uniref:Integrase catalytic domain-containing protein n=1 Tax=Hibiscus syriacus TaxID=106335 RepID=A0A6A3BXV9_HIBSY|nr:hypothetical protein F3Y22_tig00015910pilonHSYRG00092 [Hibiscus syriacus]
MDERIRSGLNTSITEAMKVDLLRPFTIEDVSQAVKSMSPLKTSGHEGLGAMFYQIFWHLIDGEVADYCIGILQGWYYTLKIDAPKVHGLKVNAPNEVKKGTEKGLLFVEILLTSLRCTIGEQECAELLLQSLPDSYDQLIINLTNSNVISLVFDDVTAAILQEENRCKNTEDKQKLGHMSEQGMKVLVEQKLLSDLTNVSLTLCEHCITSKQHYLKVNMSNSRGKSVLELVHSDVWKAPVTSLGGAKYFVSFIDDYSRRCWVYPIKKKSDVFSTFKNFKMRVELDSGNKIKCFRTDNEGEYTSEEFDDFCRKEGIKRQLTVANTTQQNGVEERMNKTLLERTRAMSNVAGLEKSFWAEAVNTTCYLVNRTPSTIIELKTPMEMWTGKLADYSNLHIFGNTVYVMYNSQEISKLNPKSRKYKFLGYADGVKGYHLWDPTAHDDEPSTFQEAINSSDASLWMMAMQEEIEALHKNNTWDLVPLPQGRKPIGNKWVFKIKRNSNDQVERYRARLVVKGYVQKEEQLNVKTSFLHGNLEEEICMLQLEDVMQTLVLNSRVGIVSRYMANPCKEHWNTVKRILRYIKGTSNVALCYRGSNLLINGYVDSDYAEDLDKSKSTTRYVFKVAGGVLSWVSKLQSVMTTSTTDAEYVAATQATRNPTFHSRTKHIRVQYHFIREKVEEATVDMQKIHTKDNIANFMTKAINADKFTWCRSSCGLSETCFVYSPKRTKTGDLLNSYLFLVCSEGLSSLIRLSIDARVLHGVRINRYAPSISHLFFADDSLIFDEVCFGNLKRLNPEKYLDLPIIVSEKKAFTGVSEKCCAVSKKTSVSPSYIWRSVWGEKGLLEKDSAGKDESVERVVDLIEVSNMCWRESIVHGLSNEDEANWCCEARNQLCPQALMHVRKQNHKMKLKGDKSGIKGQLSVEAASNPKQDDGKEISGSDMLWALQRAAAQKKKANRKKGLTSSPDNQRGKDSVDYSNVRPFEIKSEWNLQLDELEKLQQLQEEDTA